MRKACIFAELLIFSIGLMAQEQTVDKIGFSLSLAPSVGLLYGYAEEIVYYGKGSDGKISQLLWNMKPLIYSGVDINLNWLKPGNRWGLFADGSFKFGFPMGTGIMEDRDWIGTNSNGVWLSDVLTHYSVHDNKTDNAMLINAAMGLSFKIFEEYLLRTYIAYNYMEFSWTAKGGSFLYPAEDVDKDGHLDQQHFYLIDSGMDVGTYKQRWYIVSPGVSFYGRFNRFFDIDISLKLSPLIWCNTVDEHLLRNLTIKDTMDFGFFIEPKLIFSFTPKDFFALSLTFSYTHIGGTRGDSEYKEQGQQKKIYQDISGSGYSTFDIGLILKFMILNK
jgi:outer membrane protease